MSRPCVLIRGVLLWALMFVPAFAGAQQDASELTRKVTSRVVPAYPELARAMNVKGSVRLQVVVAPNGTAKSVRVIGGILFLLRQPSGLFKSGNGNVLRTIPVNQSN